LADHARDAAGLLEAIDADPAIVVGWSAGGVVALDLAASAPDRVRELVLAEPAVNLSTHLTRTSLAMSARSSAQRYLRRDKTAAAQTMYRWASGYATGGNAFDAFPPAWQEQMRANAASTLREMDQLLRPYPSRAAVRSISCPVTIIEGDLSDPSFAKAATYVRRLLPQTRTVRLTGAAHMLHIDQPEQWVDAITLAAAR
jgi:pimeloyl-ACP methyl ester carboxylesterase